MTERFNMVFLTGDKSGRLSQAAPPVLIRDHQALRSKWLAAQ